MKPQTFTNELGYHIEQLRALTVLSRTPKATRKRVLNAINQLARAIDSISDPALKEEYDNN